jgi:hypothetical protein
VRLRGGLVQNSNAAFVDDLSWLGYCGRHGSVRCFSSTVAALARPGRSSRSVLRDGFLSVDPADAISVTGLALTWVRDEGPH